MTQLNSSGISTILEEKMGSQFANFFFFFLTKFAVGFTSINEV